MVIYLFGLESVDIDSPYINIVVILAHQKMKMTK